MALISGAAFKGFTAPSKANVSPNVRMCQPLTHNNSQPLSGNVKVYGNSEHLGNTLNRIA